MATTIEEEPNTTRSEATTTQPAGTEPNQNELRTSDYYRTGNIPERFDKPDMIKGYGPIPQHPMYRTSSSTYGSQGPSIHTMPTQYFGKSQAFTKYLGVFGMFRNHSLNTAQDKSNV